MLLQTWVDPFLFLIEAYCIHNTVQGSYLIIFSAQQLYTHVTTTRGVLLQAAIYRRLDVVIIFSQCFIESL